MSKRGKMKFWKRWFKKEAKKQDENHKKEMSYLRKLEKKVSRLEKKVAKKGKKKK